MQQHNTLLQSAVTKPLRSLAKSNNVCNDNSKRGTGPKTKVGLEILKHANNFICCMPHLVVPSIFILKKHPPTPTTPTFNVSSTLRASLSGTFLQTQPDLVTPLKGHSLSLAQLPTDTVSAPGKIEVLLS